jgi:hypothetical protein
MSMLTKVRRETLYWYGTRERKPQDREKCLVIVRGDRGNVQVARYIGAVGCAGWWMDKTGHTLENVVRWCSWPSGPKGK